MQAIVAVDQGWGIGREGAMLYDLPGDLRHFARHTRGKVVVMGRGTLRSLPGGQPLKGRENIVLSRDAAYAPEGLAKADSLHALGGLLASYAPGDVFVIGGQSIYEQLIDYCESAIVTKIEALRPADRHFPNLDARHGWRLAEESALQEEGGIAYRFCTYVNDRVRALP